MKRDLTSILFAASLTLASAFAQADSTEALNSAQEAFLKKDFKVMNTQIKKALTESPNDPLVLENVLGLYRKAIVVSEGNALPTDWYLPDEITSMRISVRLKESDQTTYQVIVAGLTDHEKMIKQLQVIKYPDQVVADKAAGLGHWEDIESPEGHEYYIGSPKSRRPITTGLYLLKVELTNGKKVDGWFLVTDDMNSTATPVIHRPNVDEVYSTLTPTFKWEDFRSPQYKKNERRIVSMSLARMEAPDYNWDEKWYMYQFPAEMTEVTPGVTPGGVTEGKVEEGNYVFQLRYSERIKFGDVFVGRDSVTQRKFKIKL